MPNSSASASISCAKRGSRRRRPWPKSSRSVKESCRASRSIRFSAEHPSRVRRRAGRANWSSVRYSRTGTSLLRASVKRSLRRNAGHVPGRQLSPRGWLIARVRILTSKRLATSECLQMSTSRALQGAFNQLVGKRRNCLVSARLRCALERCMGISSERGDRAPAQDAAGRRQFRNDCGQGNQPRFYSGWHSGLPRNSQSFGEPKRSE